MIIELILDVILIIINFIFDLLPDLPEMPEIIVNYINLALDYIFNNLSLLNFFISVDLIKVIVPLLVIVINFDNLYHLVMWIIKKLPFNIN